MPLRVARSLLLCLAVCAALLFVAACSEGPVSQATAPGGWASGEGRWWQEGTDTTAAFRNLDSLTTMGVAGDAAYSTAPGQLDDEQFARALKRSLLPFYRTDPQVVDSVFERYVVPEIAGADRTGDARADVEGFKNEAYKLLRDHMREPAKTTQLGGEDGIQVAYPDSLRQQQISGEVRMQVRVDSAGVPQAIELIGGPHPTLSGIAMRATTRMRWEPAAVLGLDGTWQPIPSWTRFSVNFRPPPSE